MFTGKGASNKPTPIREWTTNSEGTNMLRNTISSKIYSSQDDNVLFNKMYKYQLFWKFYNNEHWAKNNDKLLSFNYVRAITDKVNNFMVNDEGFELNLVDTYGGQVSSEHEKAYEGLLNYNWSQNKKKTFAKKLLQMGGITGDAYIFAYPDLLAGCIRYKILDTRMVIPLFRNGDYEDVIGYRVMQQLALNDKDYIQKVYEYTRETTKIYFVKQTGKEADRFEEETYENVLGILPIIHIENIPMSDTYGGRSDVEDIVKINKVYNEMAEDIKAIIDYYAQPTTVITGGTVGELKKGIGAIWSGLPQGAQVFNLTLGEDLNASNNYLVTLRRAMHDLSGVPEEILSKVQHISNTSSAALRIMYHSLIQVADIKAVTYGDGLRELNALTVVLFQAYFPTHPLMTTLTNQITSERLLEEVNSFTLRAYVARFATDIIFKYNLPSDRMGMLQEINLELNMGIGSREEAMERLGKPNIQKVLQEVEKDKEFAQKYGVKGVDQNPEQRKTVEKSEE